MISTLSKEPHDFENLLFCRAAEKISTELDGETVILDISSGLYSGLDTVGTTIWNMLEKPASFNSLVEGVLTAYDVEEQQCIPDIIEFLNVLNEKGLITVDSVENI